jgi:hypothetical protein
MDCEINKGLAFARTKIEERLKRRRNSAYRFEASYSFASRV